MSDAAAGHPRRRFFDRLPGTPTLIGADSRFEGQLRVSGPLSLGGTIIGDGVVAGALSIAAGGHWQGMIEAQSAVIAGRITGDLRIEAKLEIGKTAVIHGRVWGQVIAIADGAIVDGEITVTGDQPVTRFKEKRGPADP
ncbi:MAG TPA: polymer-forming cytoskeletal protein [Steroidobacteraceae bacterium]|nr:polymer-forming cytoskeletal protein [Steroidobacteraceae bacterium]